MRSKSPNDSGVRIHHDGGVSVASRATAHCNNGARTHCCVDACGYVFYERGDDGSGHDG